MPEFLMVGRDGDERVHLAERAPGQLVIYPPKCGARAAGWVKLDGPLDRDLCPNCLYLAERVELAARREVRA